MSTMDSNYFLTSYVKFVFEDDGQPDKILYNSSLSKYLFTFKKPRWEYFLPFSAVKLTAVVPAAKFILTAGVQYNVEDGLAVERFYVAKLSEKTSRTPQGAPGATKVSIVANYTRATPAKYLDISKITISKTTVYVCGQSIPLQSFTPTQSNPVGPSASFLYTFNTDLTLLKSSSSKGSPRDKCEDVIFASGKLLVLETIHKPSTVIGEYPHHGVITSQFSNGTAYWQTVLDTPTLNRLSGAEKKLTDADIADIDVAILKAIVVDVSMYVVVRLYNRRLKTGADVGVIKLSVRSGAILWVRLRLTASIASSSTEVIGSLGITHASDNYLYTVVRLRNVTTAWNEMGSDPDAVPGAPTDFVSYVVRLSIWGDFDPAQDISAPIWKSRSIKGPAVSIVFSKLQGIVKALGLMKDDNDSGGSNAENHPYIALPLGPNLNDKKTMATPFGMFGSQFLRMTFDLEIKSGNHVAISDRLAELMRVQPSELTLDGAPKPTDDDKKKKGHNSKNQSGEESKGKANDGLNEGVEINKYALLVRTDNLTNMERQVFKRMNEICTTKDGEGYSQLERASYMPKNSVNLKNLIVRSRGVSNAPDSNIKERTAADVAEELVKKTTITGVCIAGALVVIVALAVGGAKIRRTAFQYDKDGDENGNLNVDCDAAVFSPLDSQHHDRSGPRGSFGHIHSMQSGRSFASRQSGLGNTHLI